MFVWFVLCFRGWKCKLWILWGCSVNLNKLCFVLYTLWKRIFAFQGMGTATSITWGCALPRQFWHVGRCYWLKEVTSCFFKLEWKCKLWIFWGCSVNLNRLFLGVVCRYTLFMREYLLFREWALPRSITYKLLGDVLLIMNLLFFVSIDGWLDDKPIAII